MFSKNLLTIAAITLVSATLAFIGIHFQNGIVLAIAIVSTIASAIFFITERDNRRMYEVIYDVHGVADGPIMIGLICTTKKNAIKKGTRVANQMFGDPKSVLYGKMYFRGCTSVSDEHHKRYRHMMTPR